MREFLCQDCNKKFSSEESLKQHLQAKHKLVYEKTSEAIKPRKKHYTLLIILAVIIALGFWIYTNSTSPGPYDDFAKCLTEKGAVMYGAIEWCKYTQEQAGMFRKSFKYLDYQDYKKGPDIKVTPTWIINNSLSGKVRLERVQSFQRLSDLTGCQIQ